MRQFRGGYDPVRVLRDVEGLYREWLWLQVADSGRLKAWTGEKPPLQDEKANTLCGGPVAGICKLQMQIVRRVEAMETNETTVSDGQKEAEEERILSLIVMLHVVVRRKVRIEAAKVLGPGVKAYARPRLAGPH